MKYAEVIGDPIAHSKSPMIHRFWLNALGIDADYRATHVTAEGLGDYFAARRADPDWLGCNITVPHKQAALDFIEDRGDVRSSIGAINTVFRADGAVVGTNTDAAGFYAPISGMELAGQPVVVIGAGGAARAILFALARIGVGRVTLLNRNLRVEGRCAQARHAGSARHTAGQRHVAGDGRPAAARSRSVGAAR
jgi:shikimate dehydrogenase